jgi:broad specificity phosphatase PhoE
MICLIRHGETEFNREDRVQGHADSPLTDLGLAQGRAAGERLRPLVSSAKGAWRFETSPLPRAIRTAQIVADVAGLPEALTEPALIEVSYGELEGLTRTELEDRWPTFRDGATLFGRAPGGETFDALMERARAWLASHASGPGTVAVAHAGVIRALRGAYLGLSEAEIRAFDKPQDAIFALADGRVDRLEYRLLSPLAPPD